MEGIFISYRREESAGHAGRVYDRLRERFGRERVFMDVSAIDPGVDFVEAIDRAVGSCAVLLVIIGRKWLDCTDASGRRRLDDTNDFIRLEVGTALKRNIRVIPVLVQNAEMPEEEALPEELKLLARRHAIEINDTHWNTDLAQLLETLSRVMVGAGAVSPAQGIATAPVSGGQKNRLTWMTSSITAVLLALTGLLTGVESFRNSVARMFKGSPAMTTATFSPATPGSAPSVAQGPTTPSPVSEPPKEPPKETPKEPPKEPAADTHQKPASEKLINMPDLTGQSLDRARAMLIKAGLKTGNAEQRENREAPHNTVIAQSPKAGTKLPKGMKVNLVLAVSPQKPKLVLADNPPEPELVTVPNVVWQPLERAVKMLTEAGLRPGAKTPLMSQQTPGTVLDQKIKAGATAERGAMVDLLIAAQPAAGGTPGETPAAPKVLAKGNLEVRQTFQFDLDSGREVQSGDSDIWFHAVTATERYLEPINGAAIGVVRGTGDFDSCSRVRMSERRILIEKLSGSVAVCVKTNRGKLGAFRLLEPVGPSSGVMKISYITWESAR